MKLLPLYALIGLLLCRCASGGGDRAASAGIATGSEPKVESKLEIATFGAGCFWHVEAAFRKVKGVKATLVGYCGGWLNNPSYRDVCTHRTGHAEAVQVAFDPTQVSYTQLLNVFWSIHDPTTPNRQGLDIGFQYRSVIFCQTPEQAAAALASKEQLARNGKFRRPIVTQIVPATTFWRAEEHHQRYLEKRGLSSCAIQ